MITYLVVYCIISLHTCKHVHGYIQSWKRVLNKGDGECGYCSVGHISITKVYEIRKKAHKKVLDIKTHDLIIDMDKGKRKDVDPLVH